MKDVDPIKVLKIKVRKLEIENSELKRKYQELSDSIEELNMSLKQWEYSKLAFSWFRDVFPQILREFEYDKSLYDQEDLIDEIIDYTMTHLPVKSKDSKELRKFVTKRTKWWFENFNLDFGKPQEKIDIWSL